MSMYLCVKHKGNFSERPTIAKGQNIDNVWVSFWIDMLLTEMALKLLRKYSSYSKGSETKVVKTILFFKSYRNNLRNMSSLI